LKKNGLRVKIGKKEVEHKGNTMPIVVEWGDPDQKTFTLATVSGTPDASEFVSTVDEINALMDTVQHKVSVVIDFSEMETMPPKMLSMYPQIAARMGHPNGSRLLVAVGVERRALTDIFSRIFRRVHYTDTLDEARDIVVEFHAQLDDST
jgi:hypothetical protein